MKLDKETMKLEQDFIKSLERNYKESLNAVQKEIAATYAKHGDILTPAIMNKFDRFKKLEANIAKELKTLEANKESIIKEYLYGVYDLNYTGTAEFLTNKGVSTSFGVLNKKAIKETLLTPLDQIALEDNAARVLTSIRRSLAQGITQGLSVRDMAKLVDKDLETNANNAVKIVRTETTRVLNTARQDAITKAQGDGVVVKKRWVATPDSRTRDSHAMLDGEVVDEDKPFSNGLMYPGDPSGEASEVINCRCAMASEIFIDGKKV